MQNSTEGKCRNACKRRVPLLLAIPLILAACTPWPAATSLAGIQSPPSEDGNQLLLLALLKPSAASTLAAENRKYLFFTLNQYNGNLGGIAGADAICAAEKAANFASAPGAPQDYHALIMDSHGLRSKTSDWVLRPNTQYFTLNNNGLLVDTTTPAAEFHPFPANTIAPPGGIAYPWTGITPSTGSPYWPTWIPDPYVAAPAAYTCDSWTNSAHALSGYYAQAHYKDPTTKQPWSPIYNGTAAWQCSDARFLYCVQQ